MHDQALFAEPIRAHHVEQRLSRYYDPYHSRLEGLLQELKREHERVLLLDAHTASHVSASITRN